MDGKIFFVTKDKFKELKKEYEHLVEFERTKTTGQEAPKILESEDLNPEFISYQEDMSSLRGRIDELQNIIENHQIIRRPAKERQQFVDLGAKVQLETNGKKNEFVIVGTLEANPELGKISNESPVGRALLGKQIGEEIKVPEHENIKYKLKGISYELS